MSRSQSVAPNRSNAQACGSVSSFRLLYFLLSLYTSSSYASLCFLILSVSVSCCVYIFFCYVSACLPVMSVFVSCLRCSVCAFRRTIFCGQTYNFLRAKILNYSNSKKYIIIIPYQLVNPSLNPCPKHPDRLPFLSDFHRSNSIGRP